MNRYTFRRTNLLKSASLIGGLAGALSFVATPASADILGCSSTVDAVSVGNNGMLTVYFHSLGVLYMCNVTSAVTSPDGVTIQPQTCQSWLAQFTTARATNMTVNLNMSYAGTAPACSYGVLGNWAWPNPFPYFFEVG